MSVLPTRMEGRDTARRRTAVALGRSVGTRTGHGENLMMQLQQPHMESHTNQIRRQIRDLHTMKDKPSMISIEKYLGRFRVGFSDCCALLLKFILWAFSFVQHNVSRKCYRISLDNSFSDWF